MRTGRPRGFDTDTAVGDAMQVFWEYGYDATSIAALREAMGISSASLYAAFSSKEALFDLVLERYMSSHGRATAPAADQNLPPRTAVEQTLVRSVEMQTDPSHPAGCLIILSATTCSPNNTRAHRVLQARRAEDRGNISRCVARAVRAGELPRDTEPQLLGAMFYSFVAGLSTLARDGVPRQDLLAAARYEMLAWDTLTGASTTR